MTRLGTPVGYLIQNLYGNEKEAQMIEKYKYLSEVDRQMNQLRKQSLSQVRMTHAQVGMDRAVRERIEKPKPQEGFKMRRFSEGIAPRVFAKNGIKF